MNNISRKENYELNRGFSDDELQGGIFSSKDSTENGPFRPRRQVSIDSDKDDGDTDIRKRKVSVNTDDVPDEIVLPAITVQSSPVVFETEGSETLLYKTGESPPVHLLVFFGVQQALLSLSASLTLVLIAGDILCASDDEEFKAELLSTTLFVNGISTLMMVTIGVRLPLYQGAYGGYLIPLLALATIDPGRCDITVPANYSANNNGTNFDMAQAKKELVIDNFRVLQGCLICVGVLHFLIGATGLIGVLLRFIGPVTIVPTILLLGIYVAEPVLDFCVRHWGMTFFTCAVGFILGFYLAKYQMPIPVWTPSGGCRIVRYPLHQVYAILISIVVGWLVSLIITECGGFTDDPNHKEYLARTDARLDVISKAQWFYFPYPGSYGVVSFKTTIFMGFLIATFISILDSIGDYYACAAMCRVPPPPKHAVNRGIMIEGLSTIISGALGCPQATTTYGANIGAIGVTKVASRSVFIVVAFIYVLFGLIGKISAVFITIPYPVLGGALIIMMGMFNGVVLSNLQPVDLSSSRNLAIMGTSLLLGLVVPLWIKKYPNDINTGNPETDFILKGLLGNPNFTGGVLACFLDNTVPGTKEERGIAAWQTEEESNTTRDTNFVEGMEIYEFWMPEAMKTWKVWKFLPFMPVPGRLGSSYPDIDANKM